MLGEDKSRLLVSEALGVTAGEVHSPYDRPKTTYANLIGGWGCEPCA